MNDPTAYSTPSSRSHAHSQAYHSGTAAPQSHTQTFYGAYNSDGTFDSTNAESSYSAYPSTRGQEASPSYVGANLDSSEFA